MYQTSFRNIICLFMWKNSKFQGKILDYTKRLIKPQGINNWKAYNRRDFRSSALQLFFV